MRLFNISTEKLRFAGILILCIFISWPLSAQQAKKEKKPRQLFDVTLKVVDEGGAPIPNASIVVGEGVSHALTDENGTVTFKGYPEDVVTVSAFRFETIKTPVVNIVNAGTMTLVKGKAQMTSDDFVPLPFNVLSRRSLTGPEIVIPGSYFERYPSTDIRNVLTGIASMIDVRELDGSPGVSPLEGLQNYQGLSNSYGSTDKFSNMPYVLVDNMPVDVQELIIEPAEIETVTLVRGILATALYGPAATGGVIYIKTKTGEKDERLLHVDIESGLSLTDRMPEYVSNPEYARLQNQAWLADGLTEPFSSAAIDAFGAYNNNDLTYPSTDFAARMLDNQKEFRRVNLSSSGGNEIVQYYSYLGYAGEGDIINLGSKSDYNRIITRQTVNVKINDLLSAEFGFAGNLTFRRSPNYGFDSDYTSEGTGNAALTLTELPSILNDIHSVPGVAYPIWVNYDEESKTPWYGVTSIYTNNLIGNIVDNGFYTDRGRTGSSNVALNFDGSKWIKGLSSTTYFGFNIHNTVRVGKANDYLAYTVTDPTAALLEDRVTRFTGHSLLKQADLLKLMDYYFQRYVFYEEVKFKRNFTNSSLNSSLTYNQVLSYLNGIEEPYRNRNTVLSVNYMIKDKYILHGVANYAGNSSFDKKYRNLLNWSAGGAWVLSDEGFLSGVRFLNYLKLRGQGGVVANETYFPNLYYVDRWSATSSTSTSTPWGFGPLTSSPTWFGTTREDAVNRIYLSRTGNPILTFEKRKEINAGFDAVLFNNKVNLDVTYYNWLVDGSLSQVSNVLPLLAGYNGARPYYNYNKTRYNYIGADLSFTQKFGKVLLTVGGNATTGSGKRVKYDEPAYRFDYQKRTGKVSDAIFGLTNLGKFASDDEAQGKTGLPIQKYDDLNKAGDLRYQDMNNDGVVDDLDQSMIGHSSPRIYYGINVALKYENFDLFILGAGRALYDIQLNNGYYWNGWGDNTYSAFVRDNIGGAYPRLTYYKVNNNFELSDFWMTKGGYFKIQNVELAYTIPASSLKFIGSRGIRLYVRGANLLTVTQVKDLDPESMNSGVSIYPLFRTFTGGVKFNF